MMKVKNNLILRAITGAIFVAALVGIPFLGQSAFFYLFGLIALGAVMEFTKLVNQSGEAELSKVSVFIGTVIVYTIFAMTAEEKAIPEYLIMAFVILMILVFIGELYRRKKSPVNNMAYWIFAQMYVTVPFGLINLLANPMTDSIQGYSPLLPLAMFTFIWSTDTGAYCVGSMIGRRKLFPRISPNKSWEGAIGGVVIAMVAGFIFSRFFDVMNAYEWIGMAFVVAVSGTFGDLAESLLKRTWGIKDSGNILPGHGGFLDRFDSSLFAIPVSVVYLHIILAF